MRKESVNFGELFYQGFRDPTSFSGENAWTFRDKVRLKYWAEGQDSRWLVIFLTFMASESAICNKETHGQCLGGLELRGICKRGEAKHSLQTFIYFVARCNEPNQKGNESNRSTFLPFPAFCLPVMKSSSIYQNTCKAAFHSTTPPSSMSTSFTCSSPCPSKAALQVLAFRGHILLYRLTPTES